METNNNQDETRLESNIENTEKVNAAETNKEEKRSGPANAASAGAAAAAGGVIGFFASSFTDTPVEPVEPVSGNSHPQSAAGFDGSQVPISHAVNDSMSYNEAFAAARAECGPGAVFHWRGGSYGTYYKTEWSALSPEYRQAFSDYPYPGGEEQHGDASHTPAQTPEHETTGTSQAEAAGQAENSDNAAEVPEPSQSTPQTEGVVSQAETGQVGQVEQVNEPQPSEQQVEVLGFDAIDVDGHTVDVAVLAVDGEAGALVDIDRDGVYDVYVASDGSTEDVSGHHISHDQVSSMVVPQDDCMADMPDYTNDDPSTDYIA